ncbi:MAG: single-stranded DNA-binding protein [Ruminococcus sp.]
MLNRTILMGRLVADPELKTTASGVSVTSFRIAVERSYVKSGEERKADFIDIVCWRQTAEFVCRYFSKGSLIAVEGQLQSRTYQAKDGTNRYVLEVVADNVSFTGERRDSSSYSQSYSQPAAPVPTQPEPSYQSGSPSDFQEMPFDDDLPF